MEDRSIPLDERTETPDAGTAPTFVEQRVNKVDRRKPSFWSMLKGGLNPRRREGRRASDHEFPIDWHDPYLMFIALVMLLLSIADAFLTVTLITNGAEEANPVLAFILNEHPKFFAIAKMLLTGLGILVLVALARARLFGVISGRTLFYGLTLAYLALVAYELWLLRLLR